MPPRRRSRMGWLALLTLGAGLLLVRIVPSTVAADPAEDFRPVAPAPAIHAALEANLKIAREWVEQKDYDSTIQTVQGLLNLTQVYSYQSGQPAWRDRITALRQALDRLTAASKAKDAASCQKALRECDTLLAEFGKNPPEGAKGSDKGFKPAGPLKSWMLLLDGSHADAKSAENVKELENYAYTIAEGANAVQHLKDEARWRQGAQHVREAALAAAGKAKAGELGPAREALKTVYQRCEACHKEFRP